MIKQGVANIVLWCAYGLALVASVNHVAWAFGTLEFAGQTWAGWLAALAVDTGLAALAYAIQQRKRAKRPTLTLWAGVVMFASISAFANVLHALTVESGGKVIVSTFGSVDALALARAVILSATLPMLVVYLGEVVSSDDASAATMAEREQRKMARDVSSDLSTVTAAALPKVSSTVVLDAQADALTQARAVKADSDVATKQAALDMICETLSANPDTAVTELARLVGKSRQTVYGYLSELETAGRLRRNGHAQVIQAA